MKEEIKEKNICLTLKADTIVNNSVLIYNQVEFAKSSRYTLLPQVKYKINCQEPNFEAHISEIKGASGYYFVHLYPLWNQEQGIRNPLIDPPYEFYIIIFRQGDFWEIKWVERQ